MGERLFCSLDRDWQLLASGGDARRRLVDWSRDEPALCGPGDLAKLVAKLHRRDHHAEADAVLLALARIARHDQMAGRTVLQAIVPGLRTIVRRRHGFADADDLAATVVAVAWERICRYPIERRPHRVAANLLYDIRQVLDRSRTAWQDPAHDRLEAMESSVVTVNEPPSSRLLGEVLADGVDGGLVAQRDADIIWFTRALDVPTRQLATALGMDERNVRQRRARAERRLRDARDATADAC